MRDVQADLRLVFTQRGLPDRLRMDRDLLSVRSSRLEFPAVLITVVDWISDTTLVNRPHRPNGIWGDHIAQGASPDSYGALQLAVDRAWQDRRDFSPLLIPILPDIHQLKPYHISLSPDALFTPCWSLSIRSVKRRCLSRSMVLAASSRLDWTNFTRWAQRRVSKQTSVMDKQYSPNEGNERDQAKVSWDNRSKLSSRRLRWQGN